MKNVTYYLIIAKIQIFYREKEVKLFVSHFLKILSTPIDQKSIQLKKSQPVTNVTIFRKNRDDLSISQLSQLCTENLQQS